jgi:hypothetical protein
MREDRTAGRAADLDAPREIGMDVARTGVTLPGDGRLQVRPCVGDG